MAGFRALYDLDTRAPLADRRLVEFCLALPEEHPRDSSGLIRKILRELHSQSTLL